MIAIIPARGGSKGLPNKNILNLNGKPLIAYTIEAAMKSKSISRVLISTDSDKIAKTAKLYGAEVPFLRPSNLATDESIAIDSYLHAVEFLEKQSNKEVENVIILLPTSPLRTNVHIDEAVKMFKEKEADSVISFTNEDHPVFWHSWLMPNDKIYFIFNQKLNNRQQVRKTIYPNGAIYVFNTRLLKKREYYSEKSFAYLMPKENSIDIDTSLDFQFAEFLLEKGLLT